jgi:Domain of unknown function (DUF4349)
MRRRDAQPDPEVDRGLRELDAALAGEPAADPDLTLLVADVRAARPQADPQFLASLDARVHAGFPKERQTPKQRTTPPWHARLRAPGVMAATLVAGLIVVGIATSNGGGGDDGSSSSGSAPVAMSAEGDSSASTSSSSSSREGSAAGTSASDSAASTGSAPPAAPSSGTTTRKVERAAELTLTPAPDEVQKTADGVIRETQANGGYVQESSIRTRDDGGSASFTLRIPSAKLDATLGSLSKLAHVGALNQSSNDITAQTASAADRLSDARAERRALLQALGRAKTDRQISSLKARLRDNRSEIAARQGELDAQRRRADLATVAVSIEGTGTAAPKDDGAWTPGDALHDAGRVLEIAGGVALIALAVLAPLGVLGVLALLGSHAMRRRRREGALDGA